MLGILAYSNAKKLEKRVDLLEASYPIIRNGLVMWLDARAQKGFMSKGYDKNLWLDLSHTGNDGQLQNFNYDGVSGWNEGLNFDGVDDRVLIGSASTVTNLQGVTMESVFAVSPLSGFQDLMAKGMTGGAGDYNALEYGILIAGDGRLQAEIGSINNAIGRKVMLATPLSNYNLEYGKLAHFVITYDGYDIVAYTNGVEVRRAVYEDYMPVPPNNQNLCVGGPRYFNGVVYSVRLYNRGLKAEEVEYNFSIEKVRWGL